MVRDMIDREIGRVVDKEDEPRTKHKLRKISGYAGAKKPSPFKKFTDVFFEEDLSTVKKSLITEVVIPTIKDFMADIFIGGIERTLYGSSKRGSSAGSRALQYGSSLVRSSLNDGYRDYSSRSKALQIEDKKEDERKFNFEDVVMRDRAAAQDLLDMLKAAIGEYGNVSVSELYDALDVTDNVNFTDNYYGWTDLSSARIVRVRNGYWIDLPKPASLK